MRAFESSPRSSLAWKSLRSPFSLLTVTSKAISSLPTALFCCGLFAYSFIRGVSPLKKNSFHFLLSFHWELSYQRFPLELILEVQQERLYCRKEVIHRTATSMVILKSTIPCLQDISTWVSYTVRNCKHDLTAQAWPPSLGCPT